jgi:hypothetical protein
MKRSGTSQSARSLFVAAITAAWLTTGTSLAGGSSATPVVERPAKAAPAALLSTQDTSDGDMLDSVERVRHVMQQAIAAEVHSAILEARERLAADPEGVKKALALTQEHVRLAPELEAAQRDQLLSQIVAASNSAARLSSISAARDDYRREILVGQHARRQHNSELIASQPVAADRLAHVNALAARGQYRDAEEAARRIGNAGSATIAGRATTVESETRASIAAIQSSAERRRQGLVETFRA